MGDTKEGEEEVEPRLVLQVRLFTQAMLDATDSVLVRLMYIQVRVGSRRCLSPRSPHVPHQLWLPLPCCRLCTA